MTAGLAATRSDRRTRAPGRRPADASHRVVVTGLGALTPIGAGWPAFWSALVAGRSGERPVSLFDTDGFPVRIAAEVPGLEADPAAHWDGPLPALARQDRQSGFALSAAAMAMRDAGLDGGLGGTGGPGGAGAAAGDRAGLLVGTGLGVVRMEDAVRGLGPGGRFDPAHALSAVGYTTPDSLTRVRQDEVLPELAGRYGFRGPSSVITSACAAGPQAVGRAFRLLRSGQLDLALAGAADSMINPVGLAGFALLGAASTVNDPGRTSRPFDARRSGLVMGEGAGMLVLERLDHARRRQAPWYAELLGYGSSLDAYHITDPHPRGAGAALAMRAALADGGLHPWDIDHVNAHGTSTALNDRVETQAVKSVFGEHAARLTVTSNKSMIGHLIAACGAVELVATVLSVCSGTAPPTINQRFPDVDCDLDYVPNTARRSAVTAALTNSFGLGGQNACLAVRRDAGARTLPEPDATSN